MNAKTLFKMVCLPSIIALYSCERHQAKVEINRSAEIALIEKTINNNIRWAKDKDTSMLYGTVCRDENYIELDPDGHTNFGSSNFKKAEKFWLDPRFKAIRCDIWDMKINLSKDGSVAWYYCMLNDVNEWDGKPACWMNTRWTGVLEKRNGKWVIVQMHFSYAAK
jgi:hypothetical protein